MTGSTIGVCLGRAGAGTIAWIFLASAGWCHAQGNLHHGTGYYVGPAGAPLEIKTLVAERYELGMTGIVNPDAQFIKNLNPDFEWYVYNSITDNYVSNTTSNEHEVVAEIAAAHGWDVEEAYLHFYDDTYVTIQGTQVFVPGWGGGSASEKAEARVPVYYSNLSRRATNFSTHQARQIHKEAILRLSVDRTFEGQPTVPDGVLFDNCAYKLFNLGSVVSGGHVLETPSRVVIGSPDFQDWHWNRSLGLFLTELKDTLEISENWSRDGKRKRLAVNISNAWTDSYVTKDVADVLVMEWRYDPVRDFGQDEVRLSWHRDRLAALGDIRSFYNPLMQKNVPGQAGEISREAALLGSLAWNLTSRAEESLLFLFGGNGNPQAAGWDTLTWAPCVDVAQEQLGLAISDPYVLASGTDPTGKPYKVWARSYANGLVLVRNRGNYNEGIEAATAISVPLPAELAPLSPDGQMGSPVTMVTIQNGQGAILLGDPGPPPDDLPPSTYFQAGPISGIAPLTVNFWDRSAGSPTSWSWTFGDGGTSGAQNPSHTYTNPGTYAVSLTASNAHGSHATTQYAYIRVHAPWPTPQAEFVASVTSGEAPLSVAFTDLSLHGEVWSWDFGDGTQAFIRNPVHVYEDVGTYTVELTVSNAAGMDSRSRVAYITVAEAPPPVAPEADFTGTPLTGEQPLEVAFTDLSTNAPTSWSWVFGDGGVSTAKNPIHVFAAPGSYSVQLTVSNAAGADIEIKSDYVQVSTAPVPPDAEFSGAPRTGSAPLSVSFTDLSTNNPTNWWWNFGDGSNSLQQNPVHTFQDPGTYTVYLVATNQDGSNRETKVDYVTVTDPDPIVPPEAAFEGTPTSGIAPLEVTFSDQSAGDPTEWTWDFGDGAKSSEQSPQHVYASPGIYSVTLNVSNSSGEDGTTRSDYITVTAPPPPEAAFQAVPTSGVAPLTTSFTDGSTGAPTAWAWEFGDGDSSVVQNPLHVYEVPGVYSVTLTVSNLGGTDDTTRTNYITVSAPVLPEALFDAEPRSGVAPLRVDFTDRSSGSPTGWSWEFGDGAVSTARHPSHVYRTSGAYTVSLTVTNAAGANELVRETYVTVSAPPAPTAEFEAAPVSGLAPLEVVFSDQSSGSPTEWNWDFGDGEDSAEQNPTHVFGSEGVYTVSLEVSNESGTDIHTKEQYIVVTVPPPPVAAFEGTPTSGEAPLTVEFSDMSTNAPSSWTWQFGDGEISNERNPIHTYEAAGEYTIVLIVTNAYGTDAMERPGYVVVDTAQSAVPPVTDFEGDPTTGEAPLEVRFWDQSSGQPTRWSWDFGDGEVSEERDPVYTFTIPGEYTVSLQAWNESGTDVETKDAYIRVVEVPPEALVAEFEANVLEGPAPLEVAFTDLTSGAPIAWEWSFGDGGTSSDPSPVHVYAAPGVYSVTLTVANTAGSDSETKADYVRVVSSELAPEADFDANPTFGAAPLEVKFEDLSRNEPTSWSWEFGDGAASREQSPVHVYQEPGTYTVRLSVSNESGFDLMLRAGMIIVTPAPVAPIAAFAASPLEGAAPLTVSFLDQSIQDPDAWSWNFGDGESSFGQSPSHTYVEPGTYSVRLDVSNSAGEDSEYKESLITVTFAESLPHPPIADFKARPTYGRAPLTVEFTNLSSASSDSCLWEFGDGSVTSVWSPSHIYAAPGRYSVTLTVVNEAGLDVEERASYIEVMAPEPPNPPLVDFEADPVSGSAPLTVRFADTSLNEPTSWTWKFGDGWSASGREAEHTYAKPGTYSVTLTARNVDGESTTTKEDLITVTEPSVLPSAAFACNPRSGKPPLIVSFHDESAGSPDSWAWDFGDGGVSEERNPTHTYEAPGVYRVVLVVTNKAGLDTLEVPDWISVLPSGPYVMVTEVRVSYEPSSGIIARVRVGRDDHGPVDGINVRGSAPSVSPDLFSATTDSSGLATFRFPNDLKTDAPFCFEVEEVGAAFAIYDPQRNAASEACWEHQVQVGESDRLELGPNAPNPFTEMTTMGFFVKGPGRVVLELFRADGVRIERILDEDVEPGFHLRTWNPGEIPSGTYYARLTWNGQTSTRRLTVMH